MAFNNTTKCVQQLSLLLMYVQTPLYAALCLVVRSQRDRSLVRAPPNPRDPCSATRNNHSSSSSSRLCSAGLANLQLRIRARRARLSLAQQHRTRARKGRLSLGRR